MVRLADCVLRARAEAPRLMEVCECEIVSARVDGVAQDCGKWQVGTSSKLHLLAAWTFDECSSVLTHWYQYHSTQHRCWVL